MMPIVNGLEEEFRGQIPVARLNAAHPDNARLETQYGLQGHPAFAILDRDGTVRARFFGPQSAATLRAAMQNVLP